MRLLLMFLFSLPAFAQEGFYLAQFSCLKRIEQVLGPSENLSKDESLRVYATQDGIYVFGPTNVELYPYNLDLYNYKVLEESAQHRVEERTFAVYLLPVPEQGNVLKIKAKVWYETPSVTKQTIAKSEFSTAFVFDKKEHKKMRGMIYPLAHSEDQYGIPIKPQFVPPPLMDQDIVLKLEKVKTSSREQKDNIQKACAAYQPDLG